MKTCLNCNKPFHPSNGRLTCSEKCRLERKRRIATVTQRQRRAIKKAQGIPTTREPMYEKQTVFALDRCPWATGMIVEEGRQPNAHLGF